jgi:hypothetical protein
LSFYQKTPFKNSPSLMTQGSVSYLFGSFNDKTGPTLGTVISNSGTGATSTVKFQLTSGNIPVVDSLVTIVGSANAAGAYNVTNASILSVSAPTNPDFGIYTITFLGAGNSAAAADAGQLIIPQIEIGDVLTAAIVAALATNAGASAPVVSPVSGPNSVGKSLSAIVKLPATTTANPSNLTGVTVILEGANFDLDSEYNTIATIVTSVAQGSATVAWQSGQGTPGTLAAGSVDLINFRFYRFKVTAAGGAGPIIAKLMQ